MTAVYKLEEIDKVAGDFIAFAKANPTIDTYLFDAPMGAGKTTLIKAICKGLGIGDEVSSPTFSLVNEYSGTDPVLHFDLYRVESPEELYDIGFEDYLDRRAYKFIEWPEYAMAFLEEYKTVSIKIVDPQTRKLRID
jgi:tRNA threonylcarbamoyladenosine biosynthesis protein TsaE